MIDFPGYLCAVFFISGCNFSCGFCHNAALMSRQQKTMSWERLTEICLKFKNEWVDAVCITGGEPTLDAGLFNLIQFFRDFGFKIKLDSNGSRPSILEKCLPLIDYIAMDIKAGETGYAEVAGYNQIDRLKQSIQLIMNSGVDYEFRTTVIEQFHSDEQMLEIANLIAGAKRYCIQPFIPQNTLPDKTLRTARRTPPARLREIEKLIQPHFKNLIVRGTGI